MTAGKRGGMSDCAMGAATLYMVLALPNGEQRTSTQEFSTVQALIIERRHRHCAKSRARLTSRTLTSISRNLAARLKAKLLNNSELRRTPNTGVKCD